MPIRYRYVEGTVTDVTMNGAVLIITLSTASGIVNCYTNSKRNQHMLSNFYGDPRGWIGSRMRLQISQDKDEILGAG